MSEEKSEKKGRIRGVTSLTLGWLADKVKKVEELKSKISDGSYSVNSDKVARSIANEEES